MNDRKTSLTQLLKEAELQKFAQEALEQSQDGEQVADKIFDKFLSELDVDSLG